MSFNGDPVIVQSDPGDIELKSYSDVALGNGNQPPPLRFDRETYGPGTMYVEFTAGTGGTLVLPWKESNDTADMDTADYSSDLATERFGAAITDSGFYTIKMDQESVAKFVELAPVITNASNDSELVIKVRMRRP